MIECGDDGQLWRRYAYYEKDGTAKFIFKCEVEITKDVT
jgi:hypothetical protein